MERRAGDSHERCWRSGEVVAGAPCQSVAGGEWRQMCWTCAAAACTPPPLYTCIVSPAISCFWYVTPLLLLTDPADHIWISSVASEYKCEDGNDGRCVERGGAAVGAPGPRLSCISHGGNHLAQ